MSLKTNKEIYDKANENQEKVYKNIRHNIKEHIGNTSYSEICRQLNEECSYILDVKPNTLCKYLNDYEISIPVKVLMGLVEIMDISFSELVADSKRNTYQDEKKSLERSIYFAIKKIKHKNRTISEQKIIKNIGQKIAIEKERMKWSSGNISEKLIGATYNLNISENSINKYIHGQNAPSFICLLALAEIFDISIDELIDSDKLTHLSKLKRQAAYCADYIENTTEI